MAVQSALKKSVWVMMADDDPDDQDIVKNAMLEAGFPDRIEFANDGRELIDLLSGRPMGNKTGTELPGLILLDLNMPRMDGREALKIIKADDALREIPIVVLTTSTNQEDVVRSYHAGANTFISKPMTYDGFVYIMKSLKTYWFDTARLPS